jgi:hypothetical protein
MSIELFRLMEELNKPVANLAKIIANKIYLPIIHDCLSVYGMTTRDFEFDPDFNQLCFNMLLNNVYIGSFSFWFRTCKFMRCNQSSYRTVSSNSYDDCDPTSGFLTTIIDGISNDDIDLTEVTSSFSEFIERINTFEQDRINDPVKATSAKATSVPSTSVPSTSVPSTSVPSTSVPSTSVPSTSVPSTSVKTTSVPSTSVKPLKKLENEVKPFSKKDFIENLKQCTNLALELTSTFVKENIKDLQNGRVFNLYQYLKENLKENGFFDKILKGTIFKEKLRTYLELHDLTITHKTWKYMAIHNNKVKV